MFNFMCNKEEYTSELLNVIKLFYPDLTALNQDIIFEFSTNIFITIFNKKFSYNVPDFGAKSSIEFTRLELRFFKICLYKALKAATRRALPWGSLTGIRPTKLFYELLAAGNSHGDARKKMSKIYFVSKKKAALIGDIVAAQNGSYFKDEQLVNLYIHIPFCPSRCNYCSFVSTTIDKQKHFLKPYCECLIKEIEETAKAISKSNKKIYSVYVGGGTPTSLPDNLFEDIMKSVSNILNEPVEFTLEAGRPETITKEKLEIMRANKVTRISVNPQTLKDYTLKLIGRHHTVDDFFKAYKIASEYGFNINVDLIAGLEEETLSDFKNSLNGILKLSPHNITVHTLSKKNGSVLAEKGIISGDTDAMLEFVHKAFKKKSYSPYYLYRQKQMIGNLENVGYTKFGCECVNNISTMEETLSVYACGAGAISKLVFSNGRIERLANVKDVKLYIEQFFDRQINKEKFYLKS